MAKATKFRSYPAPIAMLLTCVFLLGALLQAAWAEPAGNGRLSDPDFYRLVACGAAPGGKCSHMAVKWSQKSRGNIRVGVQKIDGTLSRKAIQSGLAALDNAIAEINGAGAGIHLTRISDGAADITVELADYTERRLREATKDFRDASENLGTDARLRFTQSNRTTITGVDVILYDTISGQYQKALMLSVMLHAIGLTPAAEGDYYAKRSAFATRSFKVMKIKDQDLMVIRQHYPKGG